MAAFDDLPHILSVGDVLPFEGINDLVGKLMDFRAAMAKQHAISGSRSGKHFGPPTLVGSAIIRGTLGRMGDQGKELNFLYPPVNIEVKYGKTEADIGAGQHDEYYWLSIEPDRKTIVVDGIQVRTSFDVNGGVPLADGLEVQPGITKTPTLYYAQFGKGAVERISMVWIGVRGRFL
jgi:hypothetical protein